VTAMPAEAGGSPLVCVIDYGMGNLRSVEKALEKVGARAEVTHDHERIRAADGVILPGVGAFPKAMHNLRELDLDAVVGEVLAAGTPTLGICLGMQLLFEASSENDGAWGLGLLQGRVDRLPAPGLKIPHIGWNEVRWSRPSSLTAELPDRCSFYFVHSYAPIVPTAEDVLGTSAYGEPFVCAVERPPLYGVQFHPEKSSTHGLRLLRNFAAICGAVAASTPA
jgi:imidazole glycerol-phosphate synthase subunit HisH